MRVYEKNLRYLQTHSPALYQSVLAEQASCQEAVTPYINQGNILVDNGQSRCYLHSSYHQEREWQNMFLQVTEDTEVIVLFGLGLGQVVSYVARQFPLLERLIVVEPNINIFRLFLQQAYLPDIFSRFHQVSFIIGQSPNSMALLLDDLIRKERYSHMEAVAAVNYRTLYPEYYQSMCHSITEKIRVMLVDMLTKSRGAQRWLINFWRNRRVRSIPFEYLLERMTKRPVIIVAAGPSLNKNIHLLEEAKNKAIVIAVGSAIGTLASHGITPHFRMAVDMDEANNVKIFSNVDTAACPLIYSESFYHETLANYQGPKFEIVVSGLGVGHYFDKKLSNKRLVIQSGFSVANVAFDLVCKWGCPKVILMGQDLCFSNNKLYADGSWANVNVSDANGMVQVQDIDNNTVLTSKVMLGMKAMLESLVPCYSRIQFLNASEGGLAIQGIINKPLQQVLIEDLHEEFNSAEEIQKIVDVYQFDMIDVEPEQQLIKDIVAELTDSQTILTDCMMLIENIQIEPTKSSKKNKSLADLDKIDHRLQQVQKQDFFANTLHHYITVELNIAKKRGLYNGSDPLAKFARKRQCLLNQIAIISQVINWTQALIRDYTGEQNLTLIYE